MAAARKVAQGVRPHAIWRISRLNSILVYWGDGDGDGDGGRGISVGYLSSVEALLLYSTLLYPYSIAVSNPVNSPQTEFELRRDNSFIPLSPPPL